MDFKTFSIKLILLTSSILLSLLLMTQTFASEGYQMVTALLIVAVIFLCSLLLRTITSTNKELSRFLDAARHADFSQRFDMREVGTGFAELGKTFETILKQFQMERAEQDSLLKHLKAIIENVPVPLLSVHKNKKVTLWNNAARRLFGNHTVNNIQDLAKISGELAELASVERLQSKRLVNLTIDDIHMQLTVNTSQITTNTGHEILLSLQDIGSELDARQQESWQDLVRVLTHEIMNSVTPVASLSRTAYDLINELQSRHKQEDIIGDDLLDIAEAVNTVAKRSENLMQFVDSYRKLTRLPSPNKTQLPLAQTLNSIIRLMESEHAFEHISIKTHIVPDTLSVNADKAQFEQMLINLLTNAVQAIQDNKSGQIVVDAYLNKRGHIVITITDNGKGIPKDILPNIFVPFFTTKKEGSGVGLALSRQIMLSHGGSISVDSSTDKGTTFTLIF